MSVVGIVGGGQLARMLVIAGMPLGLDFVVLDPDREACAAGLGRHLQAGYDDRARLSELARMCDSITFEFESVPHESVAFLARRTHTRPEARSLSTAQDRLREKDLFRDLGIPTPRYATVDSQADLERAVAHVGLPAILKTRTLGYDGKGQATLRDVADIPAAWELLGGTPLILEWLVPFSREVSLIGVRDAGGRCRFYPLTENVHREGILRYSRVRCDDPFEPMARQYVRNLLERLGHIGALTLELFQVGRRLLANEMAPRVHNSGHWTIEGATTSQFENHLRALLDLPLGDVSTVRHAAMVNLIGRTPPTEDLLAVPGARLHLYGKQSRPGRKLGHVTVTAGVEAELDRRLSLLLKVA
jgi:5-(carboxyamino)imidazole ribonucleotide synthase